jgi:CHAD domain-containing protein
LILLTGKAVTEIGRSDMNCLDRYRSKLLKGINQNLRQLLDYPGLNNPGLDNPHPDIPEEDPVHDFRVGVKRLTALYYFLNEIKPELKAKKILKPYRLLFKSIGKIRDGHIAVELVQGLELINISEINKLVSAVKFGIRNDFRLFQKNFRSSARASIRVPTVRSMGISERAILGNKQTVLKGLLSQITSTEERMNAEKWHKKRILLKRYHHTLDAFQFCPGHQSDEEELKQIKMLEQLLGDWHDRVTTIQLLYSTRKLEVLAGSTIAALKRQDTLLLGSAKIYLSKYSRWHES